MKRSIICIGGLCLLLLLSGCRSAAHDRAVVGTESQTEPAPAVRTASVSVVPPGMKAAAPLAPSAPEDEGEADRILGHCVSIVDALPYAADLDGDGSVELLDLVSYGSEDGYPRWALTLRANGQEKRFETDIPEEAEHDLWVGDLDEDGAYEIFFHGDLASDDYIIYAWRHDLIPIFFEPDDRLVRGDGEKVESNVFDGAVEGFEDGHLIVISAVDMLGTHWGVRTLAIGDDGVIGPVSSVWEFEEEEDRFLTVKTELRAYEARVRREPGEAFLLEPGTRLYPLASDGYSRMWFKTDDGRTGVLLLTPDEDFLILWRIDGVPEEDCFEFLPYSG